MYAILVLGILGANGIGTVALLILGLTTPAALSYNTAATPAAPPTSYPTTPMAAPPFSNQNAPAQENTTYE